MIVFLVALACRAGWGAVQLARSADPAALEFPDEQQYWLIAGGLRSSEGLRDELGFRATRMPLYPAVLSLFAGHPRGVVSAKIFHWLLGAAVAVVITGATATLLGRGQALCAGLLVALDPFLVFLSSLLLTETGFLLAAGSLWWLLAVIVRDGDATYRRWIAAGLVAAICVYLRESSLGLIVVVFLLTAMRCRLSNRALSGAAAAIVIVVVALLPWAVRNHQVIGSWCWLTTRGGISLYDGVGPQATGASNLGDVSQMPAVQGMSEVEWNRYFLRESWESISSDPGRTVRLAGIKLARMWNPFPNVETYQSPWVRGVSVVWTLPVFLLAIVGAIGLARTNGTTDLWIVAFLLLPAFYLSAMHCLFVGSVRYRLGAMPMIEMLAAAGAVGAWTWLRRGKASMEEAPLG